VPVSSEWLPRKVRFKSYITWRLVYELYLKLKLCLTDLDDIHGDSVEVHFVSGCISIARNLLATRKTRELGQFIMNRNANGARV